MGLGCKPVGKLGSKFRKLENEIAKEKAKRAKTKGKDKNNESGDQ